MRDGPMCLRTRQKNNAGDQHTTPCKPPRTDLLVQYQAVGQMNKPANQKKAGADPQPCNSIAVHSGEVSSREAGHQGSHVRRIDQMRYLAKELIRVDGWRAMGSQGSQFGFQLRIAQR